MRDGASSFGLSISHMKLEINLNKPKVASKKQTCLYHSTKKAGFLKPKYRMKLLNNEEDQESAETDIKMVVEREGEQVYLDI